MTAVAFPPVRSAGGQLMFTQNAAKVALSHVQAWIDAARTSPVTAFTPANAVQSAKAVATGGVWGIELTINYAGYAKAAVAEAEKICAAWGFRGMPVTAVINDRGTRGAQMQSAK